MANDAVTFYEPGSDITGYCTAAVGGKRFVKISANKRGTISTSGVDKGLDTTASGGNVSIALADAAGRIFGVARYDGAIGAYVPVVRASKVVVPVVAEAAITAFSEVQVGAAGGAVTKSAGIAVGYAIADAASGADAQICLY